MTRVKICGVTRETDRDTAIDAGAHALGFIVDVPVDTPREITPATATDLIEQTPPFVTTVLVTMTDALEPALDLYDTVSADALQLHGDIPLSSFQALTDRPQTLIYATDVTHQDRITQIAPHVDGLLIDSTSDDGAGGTGTTHDWDATRSLTTRLDTPVILAGGLTPTNVADAIRTVDPHGVDVATGVERTGGKKDPELVRSFITNATQAPIHPDQ